MFGDAVGLAALVLATGACTGRILSIDAGADSGGAGTTGAIAGRVRAGPGGVALPGIRLTLAPGGALATTDGAGDFAFTDLAPGSYTLSVTETSGACTLAAENADIAVAANATATGDLTLGDPAGVEVDTLVINFDPVIESMGGARLHAVRGWNDPRTLHDGYTRDLFLCSHGFVFHRTIQWIDADEYPVLIDGYRYDDATFLAVLDGGAPHMPVDGDYLAIIADYQIVSRVDAGEVDEVVLWSAPWMGFYESQIAGPGAYWVNSPGLPTVTSTRLFVMMALNYERGVAEAIHSYGHRTESILAHVFGGWSSGSPVTAWDYWAAYDAQLSGNAGCGNVHFPPNAVADYEYGSTASVTSRCEDYLLNWPNLTGATTSVSDATWSTSGDDQRDYLGWWYGHLPAAAGVDPASGLQNHWWRYVADFNAYPESR